MKLTLKQTELVGSQLNQIDGCMENYRNTLNVSIINYNGEISLPKINALKQLKEIVKISSSKMNRNSKIVSCVVIKMKLKDSTTVALKLYAPRITIITKKIDEVMEIVKEKLNDLDVKYEMNKKDRQSVITFSSFGNFESIVDIEDQLTKHLIPKYQTEISSIQYDMARLHITGTKSKEQIGEISEFIKLAAIEYKLSNRLHIESVYYIMSNCSYNIGKKINIWALTNLITTAPQFSNCFCIYDNIKNAHLVTIILPLNDLPEEYTASLWRNNLEASFTVKKTGEVTQSSPSIDCGLIAHKMFCNAIDFLGDAVERKSELNI